MQESIVHRPFSLTSNLPFEPPIANKKGLSSEKEILKIAP